MIETISRQSVILPGPLPIVRIDANWHSGRLTLVPARQTSGTLRAQYHVSKFILQNGKVVRGERMLVHMGIHRGADYSLRDRRESSEERRLDTVRWALIEVQDALHSLPSCRTVPQQSSRACRRSKAPPPPGRPIFAATKTMNEFSMRQRRK